MACPGEAAGEAAPGEPGSQQEGEAPADPAGPLASAPKFNGRAPAGMQTGASWPADGALRGTVGTLQCQRSSWHICARGVFSAGALTGPGLRAGAAAKLSASCKAPPRSPFDRPLPFTIAAHASRGIREDDELAKEPSIASTGSTLRDSMRSFSRALSQGSPIKPALSIASTSSMPRDSMRSSNTLSGALSQGSPSKPASSLGAPASAAAHLHIVGGPARKARA